MTEVPSGVGAGRQLPVQRHYIDGAFCESQDGSTFETLNPATNQVLPRWPVAGRRG